MSAADGGLRCQAVIFDLDGTLVDSVPDLALSIVQMLAQLGLTPCAESAVRDWVGSGIEPLVRSALGAGGGNPGAAAEAIDDELYRRALAVFMECYQRNNGTLSRAYPGASTLLAQLRARGLPLACVTNKTHAFTQPLLHKLGLLQYLGCTVSGDQVSARKPHPEPVLAACTQLGAAPGATVLVGDSRNDVEAARAAGAPVVCVSYGYNRGEDIRLAGPDAVIDRLADLAGLLE